MENPMGQWAAAEVGAPLDEQVPDDARRAPKRATTYLHVVGGDERLPHRPPGYQTQYQCNDCPMWISDTNQCTIHAPDVQVLGTDGCNYWVPGPPTSTQEGAKPYGNLTPEQSGLESNPAGFSCKRCEHYVAKQMSAGAIGESGGCQMVDYDSPGDDPGMIHPNACCAGWSADPEVGDQPTDQFVFE